MKSIHWNEPIELQTNYFIRLITRDQSTKSIFAIHSEFRTSSFYNVHTLTVCVCFFFFICNRIHFLCVCVLFKWSWFCNCEEFCYSLMAISDEYNTHFFFFFPPSHLIMFYWIETVWNLCSVFLWILRLRCVIQIEFYTMSSIWVHSTHNWIVYIHLTVMVWLLLFSFFVSVCDTKTH